MSDAQQVKEKRVVRPHAHEARAELREKSPSALNFHLAQAAWSMKFSFSGTSLRQVKLVRAAQLLYHFSSYSQNLKLQISI